MRNPFNVTKASEFSDEQINTYWVSMGDTNVLEPMDYTPRYILGGKGCGKTHLLRYYSYPLQKLRWGSFGNIVANDKYIGIYSVLSTLDASRFEGKNVSEGQWKALFKYYFELYIGSFVLKTLSEYIESENGVEKESCFVKMISELFLKRVELEKNNLKALVEFVEVERKNIDFEIENVAFTGSFNNVQINLKAGELIFNIPKIFCEVYNELKDMKFVYIMDEYEKLYDWQKRYVNSLVWEKQYPSTFWIGARKYGYTDMHTESGEELKKGSEYSPFFMDEYFQQNEKEFDTFARELIRKRLKRADPEAVTDLEAKFRSGKENVVNTIMESKKGNYKHIKNLITEIKLAIKKGLVVDREQDVQTIVDNLKADTEDNPLLQKYKIYFFYQLWADKNHSTLIDNSVLVKEEFRKYKKGEETKYKNIVEKYKNDLIAQLCEENGESYFAYSGLADLIKLSWGNPRVLLLLLKKTIEKAEVFQEHPLDSGGQISLKAQYLGIKETAGWYLDNAELTGKRGSYANTAIKNLAEYFRLYRFSDKPTDTSVCAFNYGTENVSQNARDLIRMMELHSFLVKVDNERKQKNSGKAETTYQINRILAPNWNLPSSRRGVADFSNTVIESLFNFEHFSNFDSEYVALKNRMNAPFVKNENQIQQKLF